MKIAISVLSSLLLLSGALAQDASIESPEKTAESAAERQRKLQAEERAKALLEKKPLTYGGFVTDLSRAEKKSRFFSLRQPRDPKGDVKNISFDERTGRPRGFVFFRLEF